MELNLLGTTLDRFTRIWDFSDDINYTLVGDIRHVGDHFFRCGFWCEGTGLEGIKILSEDDKAIISFSSDIMDSGSDEDFLSFETLVDLIEVSPFSSWLEGGPDEGVISELIFSIVDDFDFFLWLHDCKIIMAFK